jgi:hypothetical protein
VEDERFFASLFDVSFKRLITTRVVKVIFILSLVLAGLIALALFATGISSGSSLGVILAILVAPLYFLLVAIYIRVFLEVLVVLFRINENVERIANSVGQEDRLGQREREGEGGALADRTPRGWADVPQQPSNIEVPSRPTLGPPPPPTYGDEPSVDAKPSGLHLDSGARPAEVDQPTVQATPPPPAEITCGRCGTANPPSNRFCESCGAGL